MKRFLCVLFAVLVLACAAQPAHAFFAFGFGLNRGVVGVHNFGRVRVAPIGVGFNRAVVVNPGFGYGGFGYGAAPVAFGAFPVATNCAGFGLGVDPCGSPVTAFGLGSYPASVGYAAPVGFAQRTVIRTSVGYGAGFGAVVPRCGGVGLGFGGGIY